ncbi:MAG: hypothetical protein N3G19_03480 [Candidatus Pacearchaeota archaeon]|nr:hypothetical protein [Candidatus Pacearchaeota archaeon]
MGLTTFLTDFLLGFDFEGRIAKELERLAKENNLSLMARAKEIYLGLRGIGLDYRHAYHRVIEVEIENKKLILIPTNFPRTKLDDIKANTAGYDERIFFEVGSVRRTPREVARDLFKKIYTSSLNK